MVAGAATGPTSRKGGTQLAASTSLLTVGSSTRRINSTSLLETGELFFFNYTAINLWLESSDTNCLS